MHPIRTHGDAIDWPDVPRIVPQVKPAEPDPVAPLNDVVKALGRQLTAEELATLEGKN